MKENRIRELIKNSFAFVKSKGLASDGACIEASVNMHAYLLKRGVNVSLKRYIMQGGDGHWTIETPVGEFDPTISSWKNNAPEDSIPGELYEVTCRSPHFDWIIDDDVDIEAAYESTWLEDE